MKIDFKHRQAAHCESGVTANMLTHHGVAISEAMAFGIGAGLFFGYLPFIRPNNLPLTTFRVSTGKIFGTVTKALGISVKSETFRSKERSMDALDELLEAGIPVGIQAGVFWLPYFPPAYRFHFNAHNLVVCGREGDDYWVSDPLFEEPVRCSSEGLRKARFARGPLGPRGRMYYIDGGSGAAEFVAPARSGIGKVCNAMLGAPLPLIGVRGVRFLAGRMERWEKKLGRQSAIQHVAQVIRMQEEIGTGGAGFRFIYAAFLQELAGLTGEEEFAEFSGRMTAVGDRWRMFAARGSRYCKGRSREGEGLPFLADILRECAGMEKELYTDLAEFAGKNAGGR